MKRVLHSATLLVLLVTFRAAPAAAQPEQADILIRGGTLMDGTGTPGRIADVGIRGDRIVFIGDAQQSRVQARRTIDAAGLVVAPGFIDPHTHTESDLAGAETRANLPFLMQGVTTVVTHNDGRSPLDLAATFDEWRRNGIGTNAAGYVGHGSIRGRVVGNRAVAATPAQLEEMRALVAKAMDDGALGLSTGLFYTPGSYSSTEEVIELAKVAAQKGGIYDTHMRDESSYTIGLIGSIDETIRIGREARIPVHISHIKALGVDVWGMADSMIAVINRARASGVDVTANQYPYTASGTGLSSALLPRWAQSGGSDSLRAHATTPASRERLVRDMTDNLRRRGGPASLLLVSGDSTVRGRTLAEIARERGKDPVETALEMILAGGGGGVASFNMSEADIEKLMVQPWVSTGSDGSGGHPRKYGTFARKIREYGLMRGLLSLPEIIHASSLRTAQALHIADRGRIAAGSFADVIVFDPRTIADRATYLHPRELASGMRYVLVNGQLAIDDGNYTGVLAGRVVRRSQAPRT